MAFSFIPFLIVNYALTSLPVVLYNPASVWGFRILTIPIEDFFYSFSMISFYIIVYTASEDLSRIRGNNFFKKIRIKEYDKA